MRNEAKLRALSGCKTYGAQMFDTATAGIIIVLDSTLCDNTWMADGAIAAEHILLAAAEQGLGACWLTFRHLLELVVPNFEFLRFVLQQHPDY